MTEDLDQVAAVRKSRTEPFHRDGQPLGFDLLDFQQWSGSDLLSNVTRGILAEYLVARAVGSTERPRAAWDSFDIETICGARVEVKSAAYLQSWHQERPSGITFSTRPTLAWDAATNLFADQQERQADVYVLCLLDHRDKSTVDPLNVAQWRFLVLSTETLNAALGEQKTLGLARLREIGAEETDYDGLAEVPNRSLPRTEPAR